MTEAEANQIREIVREEILGIIKDGEEKLGLIKDPTGMGRKALQGLANLVKQRQTASAPRAEE
jgi:hypothetical protein